MCNYVQCLSLSLDTPISIQREIVIFILATLLQVILLLAIRVLAHVDDLPPFLLKLGQVLLRAALLYLLGGAANE